MNPSFSPKGWQSILLRSAVPDLDPDTFFKWPSPQDFDIELAHKLEALAREHYSFYAPHRDLAAFFKIEVAQHFDLFAYRETSQATMRTLALSDANDVELTRFGAAQFVLFEKVLHLARPSAVIVINALASQVYLKRRSRMFFDPSVGYYKDSFADGQEFPVFLSGMLTGIRALDRFSKDRLFWQIATALGKTWSPDASRTGAGARLR
jgi:hypothetical protein